MSYLYSPSTNSFYAQILLNEYRNAGTLPDDCIAVEDSDYYQYAGEPPKGKTRGVIDGLPGWVDLSTPTHEDMIVAADQQRQNLIDSAMQSVNVIQLKLQAGRTLGNEEKTKLDTVLDYIDAVTAIDTSTAPDISWPELPAA